ncbi:FAD/NAD(P)-binding domain-containing protein [Daldinia caldariorum]|uniref:FAD/NAD(P)-binding domain-containing protein n=1 Tax=Daldinia caldariorum TaxID=326644 RepID=UPI0020080140|nr:FAD/NAD(P)-binding domain-containing protein [Daldinia caldariorum]KAI1469517.1 FAD/NAD(P)-binding domain-containing protein [Daldinia caldariorum]
MADEAKLQIAIIGAGIAGLGAAIALKRHPAIDVQIYEKAPELREIGASIALGPNGMRTLERLGVENALDDEIAFRNKSKYPMIYRHWKTNEIISTDSHVGHVKDRHLTARFYRAHLQEALAKHVDPTRIHFSKAFESVAFDSAIQKLRIAFTDKTTATADIILGADGIHSAVRTFFVPTSSTAWTGWVAFRSVFPSSHVAHIQDLPDEATHFWGPDRTFFVSRLGRDLFTVVGSYQADPAAPDAPYKDSTWNSDSDVDVLREFYKDWSPLVRRIVDAVPSTRVYPNAAAHPLETWVLGDGRVTLAGDAAHAHGGAFAAGGSLALDDAWAFASAILHVFPADAAASASGKPSDAEIRRALRIYERTRKPHTDRVMSVVHQTNKSKVARYSRAAEPETDEQLRARIKNRVDPSWIHEHDVQAAFAQAVADEVKAGIGAVDRVSVGEQARL